MSLIERMEALLHQVMEDESDGANTEWSSTLTDAIAAIRSLDAPPSAMATSEPVSWRIDADTAGTLRDFIGEDEPCEIELLIGEISDDDGKVDYGLLCRLGEYPEEGAILLKSLPRTTRQEPIGEVVIGPKGDVEGWTVVKWLDKTPPLGTKLYAAPSSAVTEERRTAQQLQAEIGRLTRELQLLVLGDPTKGVYLDGDEGEAKAMRHILHEQGKRR